jgi:4-hydroxy-tetrahydrodipicolinate synthase
MSTVQFSLRGVIPNLITPFDQEGEIAWDQAAAEAAFLDQTGIDGICLGGCFSEISGSSADELEQLCKVVRSATAKSVIAVVFPDAELEAIEFVNAAARGGATAVAVGQPHYLFQPDGRSLLAMFHRLRGASPIPVLLSNQLKTAQLDLPVINELTNEGVIDGIIQGGGNAHLLVDLLSVRPRLPVFSGIEDLHYIGLTLGCEGIVSDLADLVPHECVRLWRSVAAGDYESARSHHEKLLRVWRVLDHPVDHLSRMRLALWTQGRRVGMSRSPYDLPLDHLSETQVKDVLQREGVVTS